MSQRLDRIKKDYGYDTLVQQFGNDQPEVIWGDIAWLISQAQQLKEAQERIGKLEREKDAIIELFSMALAGIKFEAVTVDEIQQMIDREVEARNAKGQLLEGESNG